MRILALAPMVLCLVISCSSTGPRVLERADNLDDAPEWARVTRPTYEEDEKKFFVGFVELDGDASRSAALNMADEKALSEPMRSLVDEFLDQNQVGEEIRQDATYGQRIISAARSFRVPMPSLTITGRYWETVAPTPKHASLRAFSLAEISNEDFEAAKKDFLRRLAGNTEIREILRDVGRKQREKILSAAPSNNR